MQRPSDDEVLRKDSNNYEALVNDANQVRLLREMGIAFIRSRFQSLTTFGEAEDIVQEAFIDLLKVLKAKDEIGEGVRSLRALFSIILLRKALYFKKRHSKRPIGHILNVGSLEFIEMDEGQMGVSAPQSELMAVLKQVLENFAGDDEILLNFAIHLLSGCSARESADRAGLKINPATLKRKAKKLKLAISQCAQVFRWPM